MKMIKIPDYTTDSLIHMLQGMCEQDGGEGKCAYTCISLSEI